MTESGGIIFFAPWLKYIIPEWSGYNGMRRIMDKFRVIFTGAVEEHKSTYSEDYQRDFIDVFLKEIKECKDTDSAFFGELGGEIINCGFTIIIIFLKPFREAISVCDCRPFPSWIRYEFHNTFLGIPLFIHFPRSPEKVAKRIR
jgi:hypothetical protein